MVAEVLERYRIENGISQKELAKRLGTTQAAVSSWERGIRFPTHAGRKKIKDLTGCDTSELLRKSEQKPSA